VTDDQHRPALPGDVPTPAVTVDALTAAVNGLIARQLDAVLRLQGDLAALRGRPGLPEPPTIAATPDPDGDEGGDPPA
jgi:hypothetical protein